MSDSPKKRKGDELNKKNDESGNEKGNEGGSDAKSSTGAKAVKVESGATAAAASASNAVASAAAAAAASDSGQQPITIHLNLRDEAKPSNLFVTQSRSYRPDAKISEVIASVKVLLTDSKGSAISVRANGRLRLMESRSLSFYGVKHGDILEVVNIKPFRETGGQFVAVVETEDHKGQYVSQTTMLLPLNATGNTFSLRLASMDYVIVPGLRFITHHDRINMDDTKQPIRCST